VLCLRDLYRRIDAPRYPPSQQANPVLSPNLELSESAVGIVVKRPPVYKAISR